MMCFTWHFSVFRLKGRLCNSAFSLHTDISACIGTSPIHQYHAFIEYVYVYRVSTLKPIGKRKQRKEREEQHTNKQAKLLVETNNYFIILLIGYTNYDSLIAHTNAHIIPLDRAELIENRLHCDRYSN